MSSCFRCSGSDSGPANFILTCCQCHRNWHHKCLLAPMSDSELISRINASAENQFEGSLESWICRRCSKNVAGPSENPQQRKASVPTQKTTIILIDDSDEIEMLDSPPVGRAAETARSSSVQPFSAKPTTVPRRLENIQHSRPLSSSRFPGNYSADHRQHGLDGKGNNDGSIPNNIDAPSSVNARDKSKTQSELPDRKKLRTESGPISASFKLSSRDLPPNLTHYRPSSLSSIATINSTSSSKSVSPAPTRNPSRNASLAPFSQLTLDDRNRSRTLSVAPGRQAEDTPRASPTNSRFCYRLRWIVPQYAYQFSIFLGAAWWTT
ncbi:hypothetical protein K474DRAFT_1251373 [Panus rudis PR-1116 ss-1]|nr:hypothetical protein K474DRAFT_1251373 [Panus rudis PR-1116 ss-1]